MDLPSAHPHYKEFGQKDDQPIFEFRHLEPSTKVMEIKYFHFISPFNLDSWEVRLPKL